MTVGYTQRDSTSYAPATGLDSSKRIGYYSWRNWAGDDDAPTPKTYVTVRNPVTGKVYRKRVLKLKRYREPHNYSCEIRDYRSPLTQYKDGFYPPLRQTSPLSGYYAPSVTDPWTSNHYNDLLNKIRVKIWGSSFNPGVFLAELGQTMGLIGEAAARIAASVSYLRRGDIPSAARAVAGYSLYSSRYGRRKDLLLATNVLEVQYGWRPLLLDMKDGAEYIAHQLYAPVTFKVSATRLAASAVDTDSASTAGVGYGACSNTTKGQLIAYLSEKPTQAALAQLLHPEEIIWEKIPYSFVVDWAVPIGDYLQARTIASALTGKFVFTKLREVEFTGYRALSGGSPQYTKAQWVVKPPFDPRSYYLAMTRTVTTSIGAELPEFKGLGKALSVQHCLNGLSLLTTAMVERPDNTIRRAGRYLGQGLPF